MVMFLKKFMYNYNIIRLQHFDNVFYYNIVVTIYIQLIYNLEKTCMRQLSSTHRVCVEVCNTAGQGKMQCNSWVFKTRILGKNLISNN